LVPKVLDLNLKHRKRGLRNYWKTIVINVKKAWYTESFGSQVKTQ
jgi:hypothetical protein